MPGILNPPRRSGIVASLIAGCFVMSAGADPDVETLSALRSLETAETPALSPAAVRNRVVGLDLATISPDTSARSVVEFRLFDDVVFRTTRKSVKSLEEGRWSWVGAIEGEPAGVVQFAVRNGVASGVIRSPERGLYRVRFTGIPGVYIAEEIDEANFEPCATGAIEAITKPDDVAPFDPESLDTGSERGVVITPIDVLVGYTGNARNLAGGTAGMLAEIDLAVASTNLAYQNSAVDIQLNLVLTYLAFYNESGDAGTDLSSWRGTSDGFMDDVHTQRDDSAADLCALLVGNFNACGIGYLMTSPSIAFETHAFTVTSLGCAVNNLTFAHELGHNLGCAHDRDNANTGAYSFSFGYRDPIAPADWRTVMAYAPGTRIQHFSNPLITYLGQLTGVFSGINAADNARSLNQTRVFAENWRDAATRQPLQFNLTSPNNGQTDISGAQEFNWEANGPVDSYSLVIATDAGLIGEIYRADGLLVSEHTIPAGTLSECLTHYWGVVATLAGNSRTATPTSRLFTTRLAADLNVDGVVDTADLGGLIGSFGNTSPFADINGDGVVDTADLGILIGSFGQTCSP